MHYSKIILVKNYFYKNKKDVFALQQLCILINLKHSFLKGQFIRLFLLLNTKEVNRVLGCFLIPVQ